MKKQNGIIELLGQFVATLRITLITMVVCSTLYPLVVLLAGQTMTPHTANGSLITNNSGKVIGSELIAQAFTRPEYFWPRPSATGYDASATGGSNLSPANPALVERARTLMASYGEAEGVIFPADLMTASGSGIDPHITMKSAEFQARRVASARNLSLSTVLEILKKYKTRTGGSLTPEPLVNVLLINIALDNIR